MASRKLFYKPTYVYPFPDAETVGTDQNLFEFDESDVCFPNDQTPNSSNTKIPVPTSRSLKKASKTTDPGANRRRNSAAASVPLSIPDWSKILKEEYRCHRKRDDDEDFVDDADDDEDCGGRGLRIPPHEFLARRRGASLSVHEGVGRTLKGRDLRRVRNAIWEKTGFED